jgi:hypothetical protein
MANSDTKKRNKLKIIILFIVGPLLAGLASLLAFAGFDYPAWLMFTLFIITFPATGWFVSLSWCPFIRGWIE